MSRRIIVRVSPDGSITVEAAGFKGKGCEAATKAIEDTLGNPRTRTRKADYWRQESTSKSQQRLGGESE